MNPSRLVANIPYTPFIQKDCLVCQRKLIKKNTVLSRKNQTYGLKEHIDI